MFVSFTVFHSVLFRFPFFVPCLCKEKISSVKLRHNCMFCAFLDSTEVLEYFFKTNITVCI